MHPIVLASGSNRLQVNLDFLLFIVAIFNNGIGGIYDRKNGEIRRECTEE